MLPPSTLRGEVWLVDLGLAAKTRPCLVLSSGIEEADRALVSLVPHTTSVRGSRFEVSLNIKFLRPGAFDAQNIVTIPSVKLIVTIPSVKLIVTIPSVKLLRRLGRLSQDELSAVDNAVRHWLGL